MAHAGNQREFMSDINVTPFVDVMLVLLIIFMVTAPMMVEGLNVDLPEATAKPLDSEKEHLVITIDNNQLVYINDFKIDVEFLGEKLNKMLLGRSDRQVYLKADKKIPYGIVVKVMAEIKNAGIEQLGMITEPAAPKKRSDAQNAKS